MKEDGPCTSAKYFHEATSPTDPDVAIIRQVLKDRQETTTYQPKTAWIALEQNQLMQALAALNRIEERLK